MMGLVLFFGGAILAAILIIFLTKGRKEKRAQTFNELMLKTLKEAVPQAEGFEAVMAVGDKDTLSALKDTGEDLLAKAAVKLMGAVMGQNVRLRTAYIAPPSFIIGYSSNEMYVVCVGEHPSFSELKPDPDLILHLTPNNLDKISFGLAGKITFKMKDSSASLIVSVTNFAVKMLEQPENCEKFKAYIKDFAQKYSL